MMAFMVQRSYLQDTFPKEDPACKIQDELCVSTKGMTNVCHWGLMEKHHSLLFFCLTESTTVGIKGKIPNHAIKFGFANGNTKAFTYIKRGTTGKVCIVLISRILVVQLTVFIIADPACRSDETCSEPSFVSLEQNSVKPETVTLPFFNEVGFSYRSMVKGTLLNSCLLLKNPTKSLTIDGPQLVENGLTPASVSCNTGQVCFKQDTNGMLSVW